MRVFHGLCSVQSQKESYPLEKPRGIDVDHTAPLSNQRGSILALVLTDDLTVYKHRDEGALWEPPHVGLKPTRKKYI